MIVRKWRGWAGKDRADGYLQHFAAHVQATLGTVRGYRKALVLTRKDGEEKEIVTMTFFDRLEDVKGFAGEQYDVAKVDPIAQGLLARYDKTVTHLKSHLSSVQIPVARTRESYPAKGVRPGECAESAGSRVCKPPLRTSFPRLIRMILRPL